jgi:NAD+ kinase
MMNVEPKIPESIAVAFYPGSSEAVDVAAELSTFLTKRGLTTLHAPLYDETLRSKIMDGSFDLLIALGGDGTMLRAGHLCAPPKVPILGINMGSLGFLIEVPRDDWQSAIETVLAGEYWLEERMMLRAEHHRGAQAIGAWDVLNECVVGRGEIVRPVHLITDIDGHYLTTYVADALIVATPTGSTAYALSAGGPILPPKLRNILIVPVAPHLSVDRAIVLHEGSWVRVVVRTKHQATLCIDGQAPVPLKDQDQVDVRSSDHTVHFVRFQETNYFYRNLTSRMNKNPSVGVDE